MRLFGKFSKQCGYLIGEFRTSHYPLLYRLLAMNSQIPIELHRVQNPQVFLHLTFRKCMYHVFYLTFIPLMDVRKWRRRGNERRLRANTFLLVYFGS